MSRVRAAGAGLLAFGVLAGCATSPTQTPAAPSSGPTAVNPNTAALIAQRQASGVPDCTVPAPAAPLQEGLPDLVLPCLGSDRVVNLAHLRGQPLVVNLWAQWCEPCKAEAPVLASFAARASGKVGLLGVDYSDPDPAAAIAFAEKAGWRYPQVVDSDALLRTRMALPGIPVTLLVDAAGRVVYRKSGPVASEAELEELVTQWLGVTV